MSEENTDNKTKDLYYFVKEKRMALELGGSFEYTAHLKLRRTYKLTAADKKLFAARNAEQTNKALKMGANPNAEMEYGQDTKSIMSYREYAKGFRTPLMKADAEQTKILLEAGANPNLGETHRDKTTDMYPENEDGMTPLMYAVMNRDLKKTELLIKAGANVNAVDIEGRSVLDYAETADMTRLLLDAGAKPDERCLLSCNDAAKLVLLLEAGADKSVKLPLKEREITEVLSKYSNIRGREFVKAANMLQTQTRIAKSKERLKNKPKSTNLSGVAVADKIAEDMIKGKEKRTITREVGKELSDKIKKEYALNKKQIDK